MKRRSILACLLVMAIVVSCFAGCGGGKSQAPAASGSDNSGAAKTEAIELKLSHPAAETHPYHLSAVKFKELIEERTNGRYVITIFPNNALGNQEEVTEAVQLGTIDMVVTSDDKLCTFVPDFYAFGMPFIFRDFDHVCKTVNGEVGAMLNEKLKAKGVFVVSYLENGFRHITNNRGPIVVPDDLKGLKIRTTSTKPNMEFFNNSGAAATNISFSELYSALQLKTVDAQENPLPNILDKKFFEVQKYLSLSGHVHTVEPMAMSMVTYNKLSDEDKKIFEDTGKEVSEWCFDLVESLNDQQLEELKGKGMEVNSIDKDSFAAVADKVYADLGGEYKDLIEAIKNVK